MTLGSHQKTVGGSQDWITPKWIIDALGPFDLDPCACVQQPWPTAAYSFTKDGLTRPWSTQSDLAPRVFLNPPFDRYQVGKWVMKLAEHGRGTALLHARTEAEWFCWAWGRARAILFMRDRIYFHYPDGTRAKANSGAPACLVAFGDDDARSLIASEIKGNLVWGWTNQ